MHTKRASIAGLVIIGIISSLIPLVARADDGVLGTIGFAVTPLDDDQVQMVAEWVQAEVGAWSAQVTCVFTFTNAGPATTVLMGFPEARDYSGRGDPSLHDFRAFVDGQEVATDFRPQAEAQGYSNYAGWHTFSVSFAADQTRVVSNSYRGGNSYTSNGEHSFSYILQTGSTWAGPIGQADIVVRWSRQREVALNTIFAYPKGSIQEGYELHWTFRNFEPTSDHDIRVSFFSVVGPDNGGIAAASSGNVVSEWKGSFQPSAPFADDWPSTAWMSDRETGGAWILWSSGFAADQVDPTVGLGILPGIAGQEFYDHGRPKEILIRLAQLTAGLSRPDLAPTAATFSDPPAAVEIREFHLTLQDAPRWQFLYLDEPATVLAFQILVESVYPGQRFDDVAIAEVWFPLLEEDIATSFSFLPNAGGNQSLGMGLMAILGTLSILAGSLIHLRLRRYRHQEQALISAAHLDSASAEETRLYLIDAATGAAHVVDMPAGIVAGWSLLAWSPTGQMFSTEADQGPFLYQLDTNQVIPLPSRFSVWLGTVFWSPRAFYGPEACEGGK